MNEEWKLWKSSAAHSSNAVLLRYGGAVMLTLFVVFLVLRVPGVVETAYFLSLAAVVLSAFYGGLGPSLLSLSLCVLAAFFLFLSPSLPPSLMREISFDDGAQLVEFGWVSLIVSFLIAGSQRSRDKLRQSEERYRALVQTAPDAIAAVDSEGVIIFVTPAAGKLFECSCDQMLGLPLSLFVPGCFCQSHLAKMKDLDTRQVVTVDFTGRNVRGEAIPLEASFGVFANEGQNVFSAFLRDRRKLRTEGSVEQSLIQGVPFGRAETRLN